MTVHREVKAHRRRIIAEHIDREYRLTGRTAFEQWEWSVRNLAPVHRKINHRHQVQVSRRWHEEFWRLHHESMSS